ncbi:serine hydroxymethyltransferase [Devosia sp. XJ19-1]|uniref:Serine hydroxymethyltransferase n=1 Tax=Devosia ureilytica TaxID=2952754 RepID=A0A9Q4AL36_9HYPH|nr:serine hydroxymethyltransferase [Devosia ureilytica]MCP8882510.1 serine hydroxymethyltransferase [Devosia ureilytica]MCP8885603.1 serine hydroxymethyltransferase [Devosia ureilytica]
MSNGDVLFEFVQMGQQMRVAAIDEATGIEVVVITPLTATKLQMQRVAMAKLQRKLEQDRPAPRPISGKFA